MTILLTKLSALFCETDSRTNEKNRFFFMLVKQNKFKKWKNNNEKWQIFGIVMPVQLLSQQKKVYSTFWCVGDKSKQLKELSKIQ